MQTIQMKSPTVERPGTLPRREFLQYLGAGALGLAMSLGRAKAQDSGAAAAPAAPRPAFAPAATAGPFPPDEPPS